MTEKSLKNFVSIALVVAHASTLLLVLGLYVMNGLTDEQVTTTVGMLIPMLAAVVGMATKHIIASKNVSRDTSKKVSNIYVFGVVFFAGLYLVTITTLLLLKSFNIGFKSFEAFKIAMTVTETIFGAYTGKVLGSLFEPVMTQKDGGQ
jgi:hypothetical protein